MTDHAPGLIVSAARSGPNGAFPDGAFGVVPIVVPPFARLLRNAYVAIGRALQPLDVADADVAVAFSSRLHALLVKRPAVLGARRFCAPTVADDGAGADDQEQARRIASHPDHDRSSAASDREASSLGAGMPPSVVPGSCFMSLSFEIFQRLQRPGVFIERDGGWASDEAGVRSGDGADGESGWPIACRIAAISSCCVTMISWAIRRSCSLRP